MATAMDMLMAKAKAVMWIVSVCWGYSRVWGHVVQRKQHQRNNTTTTTVFVYVCISIRRGTPTVTATTSHSHHWTLRSVFFFAHAHTDSPTTYPYMLARVLDWSFKFFTPQEDPQTLSFFVAAPHLLAMQRNCGRTKGRKKIQQKILEKSRVVFYFIFLCFVKEVERKKSNGIK